MNQICRVCLQETYVNPASKDEVDCLQNLLTQDLVHSDSVSLCVYCKYTMRKFKLFIRKCNYSNQYLLQLNKENTTKIIHSHPILTKSRTNIETIEGSEDPFAFECKLMKTEDDLLEHGADEDDDDDIPLAKIEKTCDNETLKTTTSDDQPLSLLNGTPERDRAMTETKQRKNRRRTTVLKKSSRMVLETEEYLVIKLTKEEVLKEMQEKSLSEKYQSAPFKCERCVRGFNFEDVLDNHRKKHAEANGEYECDICHQYCPSTISLRGHTKSHTTRYKCKLCDTVRLSRQHLLEHYAINHMPESVTYTCENCDFVTNKRTVIQRHVKTHAPRALLSCEKCGLTFHNVESLRAHSKRHDKSSMYHCSNCTRVFVYKSLLTKHLQLVHGDANYYCVECDITFKSPDNLRIHFNRAKRHRTESSYRHACPQCASVFPSPSSLSSHRTRAHGRPAPHGCPHCARAFSGRDALRGHLRRAHRTQHAEVFACRHCRKVFNHKSSLTRHQSTQCHNMPHT